MCNFYKLETVANYWEQVLFINEWQRKRISSLIIDNFFEFFLSELEKFNNIKISSFGTFKVSQKKERIGRNPHTKVEAKITARKVVKFRPSIQITKKINNQ